MNSENKTELGPIEYLRNILIEELDLGEERVIVYNQKYNLPTDDRLFVVVEFRFSKPYGSKTVQETQGDAVVEVQTVNVQEHYTIGIFSRSTEALKRKHEIGMALGSIYSQQVQEEQAFRIARISPVQDLSPLEGTALLYRFDVDVVVLAWYEKTKSVSAYFDSFKGEVDVDETQAQIEFNQPTA